MTQTTLTQTLLRFAKSDMTKARKSGGILISQTKRGLVELEYNREAKRYSIISQDGGKFQQLNMTAKQTEDAVADIYDVIVVD